MGCIIWMNILRIRHACRASVLFVVFLLSCLLCVHVSEMTVWEENIYINKNFIIIDAVVLVAKWWIKAMFEQVHFYNSLNGYPVSNRQISFVRRMLVIDFHALCSLARRTCVEWEIACNSFPSVVNCKQNSLSHSARFSVWRQWTKNPQIPMNLPIKRWVLWT